MEQTNFRYKNNKYRGQTPLEEKSWSSQNVVPYNLMSIYDYSGTLQLNIYKKNLK